MCFFNQVTSTWSKVSRPRFMPWILDALKKVSLGPMWSKYDLGFATLNDDWTKVNPTKNFSPNTKWWCDGDESHGIRGRKNSSSKESKWLIHVEVQSTLVRWSCETITWVRCRVWWFVFLFEEPRYAGVAGLSKRWVFGAVTFLRFISLVPWTVQRSNGYVKWLKTTYLFVSQNNAYKNTNTKIWLWHRNIAFTNCLWTGKLITPRS